MFAALVSLIIVQAATTLPGWTQSPTSGGLGEYAKYTRKEQDGTDSVLDLARQNCACDPRVAASLLVERLASIPSASIKRDAVTMCGQPAERVIATGLVQPNTSQRNFEVFFFRIEPYMYSFDYTFTAAQPKADAENALVTLCSSPAAPAPTPSATS